MFASVRALLAGIVDYAGMFPPAKLPLEQVLQNYLRYRTEAESWMLGRFVCPVGQLGKLQILSRDATPSGTPIAISVLGSGGSGGAEFLANFRADLETIGEVSRQSCRHAVVDVMEVRFPSDTIANLTKTNVFGLFANVSDYAERLGPKALTLYFEISLAPPWRDSVEGLIAAAEALKDWNTTQERSRFRPVGLKLRSGGLEKAAFPTLEQVAYTITRCREARVALKFTAGLHHPLRHYDAGVQTHMHGFLNVFGAGVLADVHQLNEEQVQQILADEDPANFTFTDEGFRWNEFMASTEEIAVIRRELLISFGSCSFDEPRDDLRALGLLDSCCFNPAWIQR
jgi:hypothetical protein